MFRLVECNNPNLRSAIKDGRRYNNKSDVDFVYADDKKLCKWCCGKPTLSFKHAYCSEKCKLSATILLKPQCRAGAVYLLLRQRFKCAHCKYSWKEVFRAAYKQLKRRDDPKFLTAYWFGRYIGGHDNSGGWAQVPPHRGAQIDHVIPIWDSGETFGLDNLQVLCTRCHTIKSSKESSLRQFIKRKNK